LPTHNTTRIYRREQQLAYMRFNRRHHADKRKISKARQEIFLQITEQPAETDKSYYHGNQTVYP
jgi:hypothetical protein